MKSLGCAAAVLLALAACSPDLGLPDSAVVTCGSDGACPSGRVCHNGLCVTSVDDVLPDLAGTPTVTPAVGKQGTRFSIALVTTKELAGPALVTLALSPPLELSCPKTSALHYACEYLSDGTENGGHGGALPFDVKLVDASANVTTKHQAQALNLDFEPPVVAAQSLSPQVARLGSSLQVFLSVNEELGAAPVLHVSPGLSVGGTLQTDLPLAAEGATRNYRLVHEVTAADPAGTLSFSVSLTDVSGNAAAALPLGTIAIDNTLPQLTLGQLAPAVAREATAVSVTFSIDKQIAGLPTVTLGGSAMTRDATVAPPQYRYTATAHAAAGDGLKTVLVSATDLAGNVVSRDLGALTFDFQLPAVLSTSVSPPVARLGSTVLYTVSASEALASPPVLHAAGLPAAAFSYRTGTAYVFEHVITAADANGSTPVSVDLTDLAGNAATGLAGVPFVVDTTVPALSNLTLNARRFSALPGHNHLDLAFDASESLDAPAQLNVWLQGPPGAPTQQLVCSAYDPGLSRYACTYDLTGTETEGDWTVAVLGRDVAGNETYANAPVVFDFTAPAVVSASANPALAKLGDTVVYSLSANEPLAAAPAFSVTRNGGPETLAFTLAAGTTYAFRHPVTGADTGGDYSPTVTLVDTVGNSATAVLTDLIRVDSLAPQLSSLTIDRPRLAPGKTVTVTFHADEALPAGGLVARVDGRDLTCGAFQAGAASYQCSYTALGTEVAPGAEVPALIAITGTDAAGNSTTLAGSTVWDFKAPKVVSTSITYQPAVGNILDTVTKATIGTKVSISFVSDEALDTAQTPTLAVWSPVGGGTSAGTFTAVPASISAFGVTFSGQIDGAAVTDDYALLVGWVDLAGNQTNAAVFVTPATLPVKVGPPAFTVAQGQVVYHRSPLGNGASETIGAGPFAITLPFGPFFELAPADPLSQLAIPGNAFLADGTPSPRIRVWADPVKNTLLGTATLNPTTYTYPRPRLAISTDLPQVYVSGADEAGNESQAMPIQNVELVATPGAYLVGPVPHALNITTLAGPARDQDPLLSSPAPANASAAEGDAIFVRTAPTFRLLPGTAVSIQRTGSAIAYDAARGRLVLFGGEKGPGQYNGELWEWDGATWQQRPSFNGPSARAYAAMAYDSWRNRVVLFGGIDSTGVTQDLWEWDGTRWTQVATGPINPPARQRHAMAFDARRGRLVLAGGEAASTLDDVWEWNGQQWQDVSGFGTRPPPRTRAGMAFDPDRGRIALFGGSGGTGPRQDLWEWDGASWTQVVLAGPPPARAEPGVAYDPVRHELLVFGGVDGAGPRGDLWARGASGWSQKLPPTDLPSARKSPAMAFDAADGRVLVMGGEGASGSSVETWLWDGTGWQGPVNPPPAHRNSYALATDTLRRRVVLFGGEGNLADTWEWNGAGWNQRLTANAPTGGRDQAAVAFDSDRNRVVLFGGHNGSGKWNDVWEYDGTNWVDRSPPFSGNTPEARMGAAAAYDPDRHVVVIYGGLTDSAVKSDVILWDGTSFQPQVIAGSSPGPRTGAKLVWNPPTHSLVLFGGMSDTSGLPTSLPDDTWALTSAGWSRVNLPGTGPTGRTDHTFAFDAESGSLLLFAGLDTSGKDVTDAWAYSGIWTIRRPTVRPAIIQSGPPRTHRVDSMVTAPDGRLLFFGAADQTSPALYPPQTWVLDMSRGRTAAATLKVSLQNLVPAGTALTGLRVRADCGGNSGLGSAPGAALFGWSVGATGGLPGAWARLQDGAAGIRTSDPLLPVPPAARIDWTAPQASTFLTERDQAMAFQCQAAAGTDVSSTEATVALDYIEARVRYSLP